MKYDYQIVPSRAEHTWKLLLQRFLVREHFLSRGRRARARQAWKPGDQETERMPPVTFAWG